MSELKKESTPREKVAEVLKSNLERRLFAEEDATIIAGHTSQVVTAEELDEFDSRELTGGWDETKFQEFTKRLSEQQQDSELA